MPNAAIVATALTDHSVRAYGLYIDGLDVAKKPGGSGFGVDPSTVTVDEAGPDGVSQMTFTIDDPLAEITLIEGQVVRFWDIAQDRPLFLGFTQMWASSVWGLGRQISVTCVGIEALLDWMIVPTYTTSPTAPGGPASTPDMILSVVRAAESVGYPLRVSGDLVNPDGSLANPIGYLASSSGWGYAGTVTGLTLREAIRQMLAVWFWSPSGASLYAAVANVTIDFYGALRVWRNQANNNIPTDYADLTINDVYAGPIVAEDLSHEVDYSAVTHAVFIAGANAAGTGLVTDGSGKPGPITYVSDANSSSEESRSASGAAYLSTRRESARGSFSLTDWTPTTNIRAGSLVFFTTEAQVGLNLVNFRIMNIAKTFAGSRQTWTITYGGLPPRATTLLRRLTRQTWS